MEKAIRYLSWGLLSVCFFSPQVSALEKNHAAPGFELHGLDGSVKLARYQGKLIYLDFWASWCGPCRQSFPWMNEMQAKYGAQGLQVIGINLDVNAEDARQFLTVTPARFIIAFDPVGATPRSYGVKGMPSSFLIDPEGKILFEHIGFKETDRVHLENQIHTFLDAKK
ncbi:TlpA family protein disulfide reductase [Undibacterium sp. Jales W-56]|uniref:TlpA family protein disulfide reductase n=1 Tax=Undibacterium sp. Jales W-56 TaxID=2897325 RepID=UPI0021D14C4D|nr:TlpA disulfide reductase family protein [Undibacterium sp. Jales W-56]MCU6434030.1 TlpA family protein disulfide reductase [Undibacterium sp. Jales W-56]